MHTQLHASLCLTIYPSNRPGVRDVEEELPAVTPSAVAERMRRSRKLRRAGQRCILFTIRDSEVAALMTHGLLDRAQSNDRHAIGIALGRLMDRIPPERWPVKGLS